MEAPRRGPKTQKKQLQTCIKRALSAVPVHVAANLFVAVGRRAVDAENEVKGEEERIAEQE